MKKQKFNTGDIFAIPLPTGQYLFGRILFDVYKQCNQPGANVPAGTYFDFFAGCFLIEVYEKLTDAPVYQPSSIVLPGVFTSPTFFKNGTWPIVAHQDVNPHEVDFPESLISRYPGIYFNKGEINLLTKLTEADYERIKVYSTLNSPYGIGAMALHHSGRRELIEERYLYDEYLERTDLRYKSTTRDEIYNQLGEDPKQSYYQLALKHKQDLSRLY